MMEVLTARTVVFKTRFGLRSERLCCCKSCEKDGMGQISSFLTTEISAQLH
jgi:hypothetical protein